MINSFLFFSLCVSALNTLFWENNSDPAFSKSELIASRKKMGSRQGLSLILQIEELLMPLYQCYAVITQARDEMD